jgi:single-stranded DNA-binding protein
MNLVVISGIVQAPAKTQDKPGFSLMFFTMENEVGYKDKKKKYIFNVKKIGKAAGSLAKYIVKGRYVTITGVLTEDTFQQNGKTQKITVLLANNIELGGMVKDDVDQTNDANPFGGGSDDAGPGVDDTAEDANPFGA